MNKLKNAISKINNINKKENNMSDIIDTGRYVFARFPKSVIKFYGKLYVINTDTDPRYGVTNGIDGDIVWGINGIEEAEYSNEYKTSERLYFYSIFQKVGVEELTESEKYLIRETGRLLDKRIFNIIMPDYPQTNGVYEFFNTLCQSKNGNDSTVKDSKYVGRRFGE